jgi:hypothetical protein
LKNEIVQKERTWVTVADAARYSGVGRGAITSACKDGRIPTRNDKGRRLVPLELVLLRLVGKDIDRLRARVEKAANMPNAPAAVHDWAHAWQTVMFPVLDRLKDAERRAALAEAQLDILKRHGSHD